LRNISLPNCGGEPLAEHVMSGPGARTSGGLFAGTLTYEGTWLSDRLQRDILLGVLKQAGLTGPDQQLPEKVRVKHGVNGLGKKIHYYLNYSSNPQSFTYPYGEGSDLLTGKSLASSQKLTLKPWDLAIIMER
jgi:beta-galactosidase